MPLSEYEQRVLEQMERALSSDDPRLASTLQQARRKSPMRYVLAGVGVVAGLLLLVVGVSTSQTWVGVVGFVLMFAGVAYAFSSPRKSGPTGVVREDGSVDPSSTPGHARPATNNPRPAANTGRPARGAKNDGFLSRLEERWERRRQQGS
ncbi:DUF3040 domain-containing protein [Isoptericola cucumis]|jgi:hypothetical protein|uniref:DUF3040 domain-containing protein n=1 Tax=Isoptericola cucumis TaxID=1776856 RepID=A0ABQ2B550_9MICO|nr:DUF3040 domain-containing protein [Isoptericola cucumis]GGI07907.1 hypothetical protein GCM10007368_18520 [Isoptericola cucumis]